MVAVLVVTGLLNWQASLRAETVTGVLAHATMTPDLVRRLIPEAADLEVVIHRLPNLRALNIVLIGYLGDGVASSTSSGVNGISSSLASARIPRTRSRLTRGRTQPVLQPSASAGSLSSPSPARSAALPVHGLPF